MVKQQQSIGTLYEQQQSVGNLLEQQQANSITKQLWRLCMHNIVSKKKIGCALI